MNNKIKEILKKHKVVIVNTENTFDKALIEICELQKIECSKHFDSTWNKGAILQSKNIAE